MHLSYAVATPVVAVFSARDYPNQWYPPLQGNNKVLRSFEETCSPCLLEECPYNNACLRRIKPEAVIAELDKIISSNGLDPTMK
jgi:ADP-heptose:LPS heptosyltransferase